MKQQHTSITAGSPFQFINSQCRQLGICEADLNGEQLHAILNLLQQDLKHSHS